MGREAGPFMHPMEQPGIPDFALHGHLAMPPIAAGEHFWPSIHFPPMFNPALGLQWAAAKSHINVPSFHALLSQYVLSGAVPSSSTAMGQMQEEQSRSSSPVETASPSQMSPSRALDNLRIRAQEMLVTEQKHLRAKS